MCRHFVTFAICPHCTKQHPIADRFPPPCDRAQKMAKVKKPFHPADLNRARSMCPYGVLSFWDPPAEDRLVVCAGCERKRQEMATPWVHAARNLVWLAQICSNK